MNLPIVYHTDYVAPLPSNHRFPMRKFSTLYEILLKDEIAGEENTFYPEIIPDEILCEVHDSEFIKSYKTGSIDQNSLRRIGLPWSNQIVKRTFTALGGSLLTARLALQYGLACNTAGGTHHAFRDFGSGFCIFNDLALVAKRLIKEKLVKKIMIVDLDVHQGDGTALMLKDDPDIFTFSIHCSKNFPFIKQKSDYDISLPEGIEDEEYLKILADSLPDLIDQFKPELIIYDAGVDIHKDDPLGKFSLSTEGLYKRELFVLNESVKRGIPVSSVIGGGYSNDIYELSYRHSLIHRAANEIFSSHHL